MSIMNLPTTFNGLINAAKEMNTEVCTAFSLLSSNEQTSRLRKLMQETKEVSFFKHGSTFYKGDRRMATIHFIIENPTPADFAVWLDNNYEIYQPQI